MPSDARCCSRLGLKRGLPVSLCLSLSLQGFTYVAPSVLENIKERFAFEPKIRSPRRIMGSPRTPLRYAGVSQLPPPPLLHRGLLNSLFYIQVSSFFFFTSCNMLRKQISHVSTMDVVPRSHLSASFPLLSLQPGQVLKRGLLGPEPPCPRRGTKCPPVPSGPGHGAVPPRADGRHGELRGLGASPHPPARRGQRGSGEAAGLPEPGQAARASTYEPMTRRAALGNFFF